jgi:phosphatidylglycerol:prolipoprotein diacylglycerol transferase
LQSSASGYHRGEEPRIYPVLFRIGDFEITSFGVLVAIGALVGVSVFRRELERSRLPADTIDAAFAGIFAGLLGAKLWWTIEFFGTAPYLSLLFSRGGLSWFGGFTFGIAAGLLVIKAKRVPLLAALSAAAPALAIGHAIGRVGCFMVGDDYGKVSNLPWAVAFPEGLPPTLDRVHPTQLYEAIPLFVICGVLIHLRRAGYSDRVVFGTYLVLAGTTRFLVEFLRINAKVLGPMTVAQLAALTAVAAGAWLLAGGRRL